MKSQIAVALVVSALGLGAAAAQTADDLTELRGEWTRAGAGFACKVPVKRQLASQEIEAGVLSRACQHLGPLVVGQDAQAVRAALGPPHKTLPQPNGASALIYFLEQQGAYPYLVVTVLKGRVVALQVTGPAAAKGYGFNHLDLGATTDALVQAFGQPGHFEPSEEKDTELWTYPPWPFSFEVRDGHVTSIRVSEP
jgi:hypothetical protein